MSLCGYNVMQQWLIKFIECIIRLAWILSITLCALHNLLAAKCYNELIERTPFHL